MRRRVLLVRERPYLNVEPTEVQWITPELPVEYTVMTNREWQVV